MRKFRATFKDTSATSQVVFITVDFIADDYKDADGFCSEFIDLNDGWKLEVDSLYEMA